MAGAANELILGSPRAKAGCAERSHAAARHPPDEAVGGRRWLHDGISLPVAAEACRCASTGDLTALPHSGARP